MLHMQNKKRKKVESDNTTEELTVLPNTLSSAKENDETKNRRRLYGTVCTGTNPLSKTREVESLHKGACEWK